MSFDYIKEDSFEILFAFQSTRGQASTMFHCRANNSLGIDEKLINIAGRKFQTLLFDFIR